MIGDCVIPTSGGNSAHSPAASTDRVASIGGDTFSGTGVLALEAIWYQFAAAESSARNESTVWALTIGRPLSSRETRVSAPPRTKTHGGSLIWRIAARASETTS